ncbi:neutral zinc metallopeptidase [Kribbella sp. NPDC004875]|uniref:neutral zinc metallopeptidase n=1 Tax=Kribbella sp. NPDC004875 TaxID=3364107 RepID=UPI0036CDB616
MPDTEEGTPKPGHFLPDGTGEPQAGSQPLTLTGGRLGALSRARSIAVDETPVRRKARPLPTDPGTTSEYSGPPVAPLTTAPAKPLAGTRRVGGPRPTGWHANPSRSAPQFSSEPPPVKPPRHHSRKVVAALSALVLVMLTGATVAGFKLVNSYGERVDNPLAQPSVKKSVAPLPTPPDPTVTVTATTVPDVVRLRQNTLYKAGAVAAVSCREPAIKPNSQSAILRYYKALLPCLDKAWAPVIKRAGYTFRSPKVVLQSSQNTSTTGCTGEEDVAYYCGSEESINISWKSDLKFYKDDPIAARVWMMDTMAHEYGHHVQEMTEILTAAWSREGWAKNKVEELEWTRRKELQASCLGAAFLGANKKSLGLSGRKLEVWQWETQHSGDEYNDKKIRDHGSRKNHWLWAEPAFNSADPKVCNTFTAAPAKVS